MSAKLNRPLLLAARDRIDRGCERFLCNAVINAAGCMGAYGADACAIHTYINWLLCGPHTLNAWIRCRTGEAADTLKDDYRLRITRLAWIDWMLEQPEFKEN